MNTHHILEVTTLVDAVHRIAGGGTVLDPDVIRHLLGRKSVKDRIATLTDREQSSPSWPKDDPTTRSAEA